MNACSEGTSILAQIKDSEGRVGEGGKGEESERGEKKK
jgi:hypothetical protein